MTHLAADILLVEDNPDDEELTLHSFRRHHLSKRVHVAHDGAEALDYLFGSGGAVDEGPAVLPSVNLLDLKLPKVDGLEVLERIKADVRTRTIPVVLLTSSRENRDLYRAYSLGANSYIVKPVEFEQFSEAVRQLGIYWLVLNQQPPNSVRAAEAPESGS